MIKILMGFSLIILGVFSMLNFVSHHVDSVAEHGNQHGMIGILMVLVGIVVLKSKIGWLERC